MSKVRSLFALFTGASAAALTFAAPAMAQQTASDEIVVTSTGRSETIQSVPIAVTAVTAETVQNAGITDVRTLTQVAPSYRVATGQSNSAGTSIAIRGIGTGADNPGFEAAVAVFVDGVYRNRSGVALSELPEVERIEVLRGPQGTLFGRNTSAGAVSVITAGPEFDTRVFGKFEAGNYEYLSSTLGVTGPVNDYVALRLEGNVQGRDGTIEDRNSGKTVNDRDRWFLRGQALFDNQDDITLRVILDHSETDEVCCTAVYRQVGGTALAINTLASLRGVIGIPSPVNDENRVGAFTPGRDYKETVEETGGSGELNWDLGEINLTAITAYRDWKTVRNQDIDFNGSDRAYRDGYELGFKTFTQEVRAQGEAGRLDWLVGAFFANEKTNLADTVRFGIDGARYADALASGLSGTPFTVNGALATNPCSGNTTLLAANSTIYGSLGPGPSVLAQALCPSIVGSLVANSVPLGTAISQATALSNAFGAAVAATAPTAGQGQQRELTETETESLSLFTHNEIDLTDKLNLTLGLRYNYEKKDLTADLNATAPGCAVLQNTTPIAPGVSFNSLALGLQATPLGQFLLFACNPVVNTVANGRYSDSREEKEWSGTASLKYNFTEDLMVYGTYSRGYKAGGFNMDRSAFAITPASTTRPSTRDWQFEPEFVDNYELGWKWTLPARSSLNGALFWQNIEGYQVNAFNGFNFFNFNVESVISRGVELDLITRPTENLTIQAGALWNEAFYDGTTTVRGNPPILDGTPIAGSSEWTGTLAATYKAPIPGTQLAWLAYVDGRYQSEYQTQTLNRNAITDQDAFGTINARLGIGGQDGTWGVEVWGRNITDEYYIVGAFGVPEQTGNFAVYPGEPRMYGVTLRANF